MKPILDVACGSKMFWFDKNNPNVEFCDNGYGISYYGCSYPPYWGKVIESIFVCPIKSKSKEIF